MPNIEVNVRQKIYHRDDGDVSLLHNVDFIAKEGRVTVVLGESGCGKSTLLRLIVGLDADFEGLVSGVGKGAGIGMIFQDIRLLPWKTVGENIRFAVERPSQLDSTKIDALLKLMHLQGMTRVFPNNLSGGMAQRVALARALVNEPAVLLFDEPFSALDSFTRNELQQELLQVVQQKRLTCIFVTHDLDEALFLADTVTLISSNSLNASVSEDIRLGRPRDRLSLEFADERRRIGELLRKLTGHRLF